MRHAISVLAFSLFSCGAPQRPTLEQAKAGLQLACGALAVALAEGKRIPAPELAERVCDVERTTRVMQGIVERAEDLRQIVTVPPDWLDEPSPTPAGDSSPKYSGDAGVK